MARRKKGIPIHGWINFNKPVGMTSTQAVGKIRRALNAQKVGHGGTLDPLASGVLPIALGEATKTVNYIQDAMKIYEFEVTWGEQRTTDDAEGEVINRSDDRPTQDQITALLPQFIGDIDQLPPQFSAIKLNGERAYDIARDGDIADIKPRKVFIKSLEIIDDLSGRSEFTSLRQNETKFRLTCGKGTYVRSIARDIGQLLGCFGYVSRLTRTKVGVLDKKDAISLEIFDQMIDNPPQEKDLSGFVLPLQTVLDDIPVLAMKDQEAKLLKNGNPVSFLSKPDLSRLENAGIDWKSDEIYTALALYDDQALAMIDVDGAQLQPKKVFQL